ncbi:MAG: methyltransferase domain-containing protein [Saprospiraceae bacterium]|nr:methyltransferase domain-containing protein [Saprospiraceae bacterium]
MGILENLYTAERANEKAISDKPVFMRQLFAYEQAAQEIHGEVLEIGCGEGYGIKLLAPHASRYIAIDKHIPSNQENFKNIEFKQMEVPFLQGLNNDRFDIVICFQLIEHIQDDKTLLSEIHRVLKPGGKLLLTTPNKTMSLTRNPYHMREYTTEEFKNLMSQYFKIDKIFFGGVFGDQQIVNYHEKNKLGIQKWKKWDVFNFEENLPAKWFQIPYDILNRINRNRLKNQHDELVSKITTSNYFLKAMDGNQLDFYCKAEK